MLPASMYKNFINKKSATPLQNHGSIHLTMLTPSFSLIANFHDLSVRDFNSMRITNLKIYKGFDRE